MTKQYYFMFSNGSYSDYSVGGLFMCDHEVSEKAWDKHYMLFQKTLANKCEELMEAFNERTGRTVLPLRFDHDWWDSGEKATLDKWKAENDPETTFQVQHGMVALDVTEMWKD